MAIIVKENRGTEKALRKAVNALKSGKIVVFPTESSYGMGCSIQFSKQIRQIYIIKHRSPDKPLPVIAGSMAIIEKYAVLDSAAKKLVGEFMPGPLTLVVEKRKSVPEELSEKGIAFRIPGHKFAREMALGVGVPVVSTSANLAGETPVYDVRKMKPELLEKTDVVVDAGILPKRMASTVFHVSRRRVLRTGPISEEDIKKVLNASSNSTRFEWGFQRKPTL